ncbi:MAG: hypothetical protein KF852_00170 [Saprospiraceae bacterium]|nr:hypothetical protein [Saprospiraceae bacterium]
MSPFLASNSDHTAVLLRTTAISEGVLEIYNWEFILSDTCNSTGNLSFNISGNNTDNQHTQSYALTDEAGEILAISATPSFMGLSNGTYHVYSINYETAGGINGYMVGQNISGVTGACLDISGPLVFVVQIPTTQTIEHTGCEGDGYEITVGNTVYNESNPAGTETLLDQNGCDSVIVTINLTFLPPSTGTVTYTGCEGDGYEITVGSTVYNEANPTGMETLTDQNGCDSVVTVTLSFLEQLAGTADYTGCEGDGYEITVGSTVYNESNPTGTETLMAANGCDSIVTITLTFLPPTTSTVDYTGCVGDGYEITVGSTVYNESNPTGTEILTDQNGCDSTVTITLVFLPNTTGTVSYTGCEGDGYSVTVGSTVYNEANASGMETLMAANGCDSIVTITLTFLPPTTGTLNYTGCEGDGYEIMVGSTIYNESNATGTEILTAANGCDSVVTINLVFLPCLCNNNTGDLAFNLSGNNTGNDYTQSYALTAPDGTILAISSTPEFNGLSNGTYFVYSINYETAGGISGYTVGQNISGVTGACLDISGPLVFVVQIPTTQTIEHTGCEGDGYEITVGNTVYNESNPAGTETLLDQNGCDSVIVTINLTFLPPSTGTVTYTGCEGDGYEITVGSTVYNEANPTGTETLTAENGCDSVVTITLSFLEQLASSEDYTGCEGDGYEITVGSTVYNESNPTGTETLMAANGCDSIVTITLTFLPPTTSTVDYTGCVGDGYEITVGSTVYNEANPTGTEILTDQNGCDSTVTITLVFLPNTTGTVSYTGCEGDGYSVTVGSTVYNEANASGTETLTAANGCDSVVTISLTFLPPTTGTLNYTGCEGDGYEIMVGSTIYNESNATGTETLTAVNGCDSIVTINLVFLPCLCNNNTGDLAFSLSGNNTGNDYTQSYALTAPDGTILAISSTPEFNGLSNGTYFVYSINYETAGGISGYTVGQNISGVTGACLDISGPLVFVVQIPTTQTIEHTGCEGDGYEITVGNTVYNESNPAGTETLLDQNGCDSVIVTINLTFLPPSTGTVTYTGCEGDGYEITVGSTVYNEANPTGTETLTAENGCDSVVTITLSFLEQLASSEDYTGCEGDGYEITVGSTVYNESNPTGTETLMAANGCDSIVTITLTFLPPTTSTVDYTGCVGDGYEITVGSTVYNEANPTGTEILTDQNGCDSTVTITLVFLPNTTGTVSYTGCEGDGYSVTVGSTVYNEANASGTETLTAANGCDSVVTISLTFLPPTTGTLNYTGCEGDGYEIMVGSTIYNESNATGTETLTAVNGCDSIVTINLVFLPCLCNNNTGDLAFSLSGNNTGNDYTQSYALTAPDGTILAISSTPEFNGLSNGTYFVYSINYETAGGINGYTVGQNISGVTGACLDVSGPLVFVVQIPTTQTIEHTGCEGDGYSVTVGNTVYNESNPDGTETLLDQNGCDSVIVTVILTFLPPTTGTVTYTGCEGDGYEITVGSTVYNEANPTGTEMLTAENGCDSIVTITLVFLPNLTGAADYTGCEGDGYEITVGSTVYNESNPTGTETLMAANGCDSIVTVNLIFLPPTTGTANYTGCVGDGFSVTVGSTVYNESNPTGTEILTDQNGCDSTVTVTLVFLPNTTGTVSYTGCEGDGYSVTVGSTVYNEANASGTETLTAANGCDSIVTITLTFLPPTTGTLNYTGCEGDGYEIMVGSTTYNESNATGTETLTAANGCDSIVTINLVFLAPTTGTVDYTGCFGDGYEITVGSTVYNESNPTGTETLTAENGCDSIVTITLVFLPNLTGAADYTGCEGDGYEITVGSTVYNESNPTGTETLMAANGCDSIVTINLVFLPPTTGTADYTGCEGDGYEITVGGTVYNEANPTGTEILTDQNGCDSTVTITLVFLPNTTGTVSYTGCEGDGYSVTVGSTVYNESNPTGMEMLMAENGCDSIVTITLTFLPPTTGTVTYTGCEGDGYSVTVGSTLYNESNPTGTEIFTASNGCDSVVTITLVFLPPATGAVNYTGCTDDGYSIVVNGTLYDENNPTGTEILTAANGCDSVITVNLVFQPYEVCNCNNSTGDLSFSVSGNNMGGDYTQSYALTDPSGTILAISSTPSFTGLSSGTYFVYSVNYETASGLNGYTVGNPVSGITGLCHDISGPLVFGVQIPIHDTLSYTGCEGDGYSVEINGNVYDESNPTGMETLVADTGCDSVFLTINLIFLPNTTGTVTHTGCEGDGYEIIVGGTLYNESNPTGTEILTAANGCDSIVTISLTFLPNTTGTVTYTGCEGDGYEITVGSTVYNESNPTGIEMLTAANGCDSIVTIALTFLPPTTGTVDYTGCEGDGYEITVGGTLYNESNPTGTEMLIAANGCDSMVTINLVFFPPTTGTASHLGCRGDGYSITLNGTVYDENNPTGTEILTAANGCDSVVTIDLVFLSPSTGLVDHLGCEGDGYEITVGGTLYNESNPTGTETLIDSNGCDSIVIINLVYLPNATGTVDYTGCIGDGYEITVGGTLYNESNPTGTETLIAANGCDSIVTITLVFLPNLTGTVDYTGCEGDGYEITVGGTLYNEANPTGTETLTAANGCDSIVTITLVFLPNLTGTVDYTGCEGDGYEITVGGTLYNEANPTGMETLIAANGCDSIVTITLVFLPNLTGTVDYTGCIGDGYEITVGGTLYNEANPTGTETLIAANGCDSIVTITLVFLPNLTGTVDYTGCEGDGYEITVGGTLYNEANPTGTETLTAANGCDSVVTINLVFLPNLTGTVDYTGCEGDGYEITVGGTLYNEANPTGTETLTAANGCDSIVTITLVFLPNLTGTVDYTGCEGDGYEITVGGTLYNEANPTGTETLIAANGCDSIVTITLVFLPNLTGTVDYTGCEGDGYEITVGGTLYNESNPTGTETLIAANGCDSIVTINLVFLPNLTGTVDYTGCIGDGYEITVGGTLYNESNPTGTETLIAANGCDSVVTITLVFLPNLTGTVDYTGCEGDGYEITVGGTLYNESNPTGTETLIAANGCDSIVTITLVFLPNLTGTVDYTGCEGDGYEITVGGTLYNEANPAGTETLTAANGCDSVVTINLVFLPNLTGTVDYTGCEGDGYEITVGGTLYNEANPTGTETLIAANGCDSIVTITLVFLPNLTGTVDYTGCEGDGYEITVGGTLYNESNPTGTETLTAANGCDSIVTITLVFLPNLTGTVDYTGCEGDGYEITVGGTLYNEANPTGTETLIAANGCDSIVTINLVFLPNLTGTVDYTGCIGDGYEITVGGTLYNEANPTGTETLTATNGCDSIVTITLVFLPNLTGTVDYTGCEGDGYEITVGGTLYNESNPTGTETLIAANGCDSVVTITLVFLPNLTGTVDYTGCVGDGYEITVGGTLYNEANPTGTETLTATNGCDSIVTITLVFLPNLTGTVDYTGCEGDGYEITVGGTLYNEANPTGTETLIAANGCDSIVTINLVFLPNLTGTVDYTGCIGDGYEITVGGTLYNEANPTGTETLTAANGCDSIVTINLVFLPNLTGTVDYTGCIGDGYEITVGGTLYNESNPTGTETLIAANGCDSIVTITLVFLPNLTGTVDYTGCEGDGYEITVGGTLYNESNPTGTETLIAANGCDSIVTITLVFLPNLTGTVDYTGCEGDGYEITVGGTLYNESNPTGTETLTAANGCDSIVTITLVFLPNLTGTVDYTGCEGDGYEITVGGTLYNESNPTGTETLIAANGCDSVVTITLVFLPNLTGTVDYTGCVGDGYEITVGGTLYNEANPTGTETLTAANGCDSIVTITLVFLPNLTGAVDYTGCEGDGYEITVGGTLYNESNPTGTETLIAANGCDSIVTINLVFLPNLTGTVDYTGCFGDGYEITVGGTLYNESNPTGTETLIAANGCDSIVTITLVFLPNLTGTVDYTGCEGDGYEITVGGTLYNEANPTGTETLIAANGCDSIVTITLVFLPNLTGTVDYTGCIGDGYEITVGGTLYNESNPTGTETLTAANGCDSVVTITLVFLPNLTGTVDYTGCFGDGYEITVGGTLYNEANPTGTETLIAANGCDSIVTITLVFLPNTSGTVTYTGCEGDGYSVTVGSTVYNQSNPTGMETLVAANGCDSIVTIVLTFLPNASSTYSYQGQEGDGYSVVINGTTYDETNPTGTEILTAVNGCDSVVTIQLTFVPLYNYNLDDPCQCSAMLSPDGRRLFTETISIGGGADGMTPLPPGMLWTVSNLTPVGADAPIGINIGDVFTYDPVTGFYTADFEHIDGIGFTLTVETTVIVAGVPVVVQFTGSNLCSYAGIPVTPILTIRDVLGNILADSDPTTPTPAMYDLGTVTLPEGVCGLQETYYLNAFDICGGTLTNVTATATTLPATINPGTQVSVTGDGAGGWIVEVHWSVGQSTVTITGTDDQGNMAVLVLNAEVLDNTDPVVELLGNSQFTIPACADETTGTLTVLIDDLCDEFINWNNLVLTISNGATFVVTSTGSNHRDYLVTFPGPGTYVATATYTDASGNTGTVSRTLTVESVSANNAPVIYANAETVTLTACAPEACFVYSFLIEDDCEPVNPANIVFSGVAGFVQTYFEMVGPNTLYVEYSGCLPEGVYFPLISYGGVTANPTITVLPSATGNQPANIVLPAINVTIPQCDHIDVIIPITITDDCDDPIDPSRSVFTLCGVVITPSFVNAASGYFEFAETLTAAQNGCLLVASYTDGGGLTSVSSTLITVSAQPDTWAPVIVYPSQTIPVVLNECNNGQQEVCFYVTATDNCDGDLIPTVTVNGAVLTPQPGTNTYCYTVTAAGTYTVLITATDAAGNIRTEDFLIEAVETPVEPVNLACVAVLNTTLNDGCEVTLTAQMLLSGSFGCLTDADFDIVVFDGNPGNGPIVDGCGEFMYEIRLRPGVNGGDFTVCWGTVRSEDKTKPELVCPADTRTATVNREVQVLSGELTTSDANMDYTLWPCFLEFSSQAVNPGLRYYDLFTFTVSQTDIYTFEFESNLPGGIAPTGNGMAALFASATFNPLQPCQNIIYQSDQVLGAGGGIFFPNLFGFANVNFSPTLRLALPLQAGQTYTLYTTSTLANATGAYTWAFYSDNGGRINGLPLTAAVQTRDLICNDGLEVLLSEPATYYTDRDGNITNISPELSRILGYTGFPTVSDNCGNLKITVTDAIQFSGTCTDVIIRRTFRVEDKQNSACGGQPNVTECVQEIRLRPATITDVLMPPFTAYLECDESYPTLANGNPSPAVTGYPFIETAFGYEDLNQSYCNLSASFFDYPRVENCADGFQFRREWTIIDWCNPASSRIYTQIIKVADYTAPEVSCPIVLDPWGVAQDTITYSTTPFNCTASFEAPLPVVTDACSDTWTILTEIVTEIQVPVLNQWGQQIGTTPQTVTVAAIQPGAARFVTGIPVGNHRLRYTVTDECGNTRVIECPFRVIDLIEPTAICNDQLNVSLNGGGVARVYALDMDEGSNDNCGIASIEVRRQLTRDESCQEIAPTFSAWGDYVDFSCCDAGELIRVELRVTDVNGNENICWQYILVEDKIRPFCAAPHAMSVDCDALPYDFEPTNINQLQTLFGTATAQDNCTAIAEELPPIVNLHDCGWGTIIRRFRAVDGFGNVSTNQCTQTITINRIHNYEIRFPRDAQANCGQPNPDTILTTEIGCDLLAVSVQDERFVASGDECYKIFRTYRVINWCEYDGQSPPIIVSRDEDCDGNPGDEDVWVLVRRNGVAYYDRDNNETNTVPAAFTKGTQCDGLTNPTGHWVNSTLKPAIASRGYWEYTQHIKVYDDVRPEITVGTFDEFCSYDSPTANDPICEGPIEIPFSVSEVCTPDDVTIKAFLYAFNGSTVTTATRLNPDGTRPTTGGFSNSTIQINGSYPNYILISTTAQGLPIGNHRVEVHAEDGCGNVRSVDILFSVVDCKAPTPICINGLTITLMPVDTNNDGIIDGGMMAVWATDYIASPIVDCTPPITYSIRRVGQAPDINRTGVEFTCADYDPADGTTGTSHVVYIDAWDGAGNRDFCETYVLVQDQSGVCAGPLTASIAGTLRTEQSEPIEGAEVALSGPLSMAIPSSAAGAYGFTNLDEGYDYTITPLLDVNYLNGVSTFDLVLIQRHILGIAPLNSPYKIIAADANNSQTVTTADIILLRRLILGIIEDLPTNTSWRFVDAAYVFPVPGNPWFEPFPEVINVNDLYGNLTGQDFVGVKIGDVNGSAVPNLSWIEDRNTAGLFAFNVEDQMFKAGDRIVAPFRGKDMERIAGYQLTLGFDQNALTLEEIEYGRAGEGNFGLRHAEEGLLTMSWHETAGSVTSEEVLFSLVFRAAKPGLLSDLLRVSSEVTRAEAYNRNHKLLEVALNFGSRELKEGYALYQNQPNPFEDATVIGFYLPQAGEATLTVTDVRGRVLKVLKGDYGRGYQQLTLAGEELPAGVLQYTLTSGEWTQTRKMVRVR